MFGGLTAVLDFGSSKISVLVGEKNQNATLKILAKGISDYAGFMDGEFLEPNALRNSISVAFQAIEDTTGKSIKKIIVGVPAEFSYSQCEMLELVFHKKLKINRSHLVKLIKSGEVKTATDTHSVIDLSTLYFKLDDGVKVENPVGKLSGSLSAYVSYVQVENSFINQVSSVLYELGVKKIDFASSPLAEGEYLLDEESKKDGALLIDCGYITTSVSFVVSGGIADLKSFSLGGGHIASDLSELLNIPFSSAEQLKRKAVLTLNCTDKDFYEVIVNNKHTKFSAKKVNDIVLARVDGILDTILDCVENFDNELTTNVKFFITGGGLSYLKGLKAYASSYLKYDINIVAPKPLQWAKPDLSSEISLLDVSFSQKRK